MAGTVFTLDGSGADALVGAAVTTNFQTLANFAAKQVLIYNDDAANSYTVTIQGTSQRLDSGETVRVVGRITQVTVNGTGNYRIWATDSEVAAVDLAKPQGITAGSIGTADLADDAVTFAKMQNSAAGFSLLGKATTGAGDFAEIAFATNTMALRAGGNVVAQAVGTNEVVIRAGADIVPLAFATNTLFLRAGGNIEALAVGANTIVARAAAGTNIVAHPIAVQQLLLRGAADLVAVTVGAAEFVGRTAAGNLGNISRADAQGILLTTSEADADLLIGADDIGEDRLAPGQLTSRVIAAYASAGVVPGMLAYASRTLAVDAAGNIDIVLTLPAASTWEVTDASFEQTTAGNAADTWQLFNGAAAIGSTVAFSATDGAITSIAAIPNANKAANSFATGNTLRCTVADGSAGAGDLRGKFQCTLRRLT